MLIFTLYVLIPSFVSTTKNNVGWHLYLGNTDCIYKYIYHSSLCVSLTWYFSVLLKKMATGVGKPFDLWASIGSIMEHRGWSSSRWIEFFCEPFYRRKKYIIGCVQTSVSWKWTRALQQSLCLWSLTALRRLLNGLQKTLQNGFKSVCVLLLFFKLTFY